MSDDVVDEGGDSSAAVADPPEDPTTGREPMTRGDWGRFVLRGLGQALITAGLVILLFAFYEVYVTNIFAHREQTRVHNTLERQWARGHDPLPLPGGGNAAIPTGVGIANLYMPRLGRDYAFTIVQGTDDASLEKGPGHYTGTALPGQTGNFSIAGHRVGKGEPFLNLDRLRPGDPVIVETATTWFVYRVKGAGANLSVTAPDGVPGREIVGPSDGSVLLPVPNHPAADPTEKLMTMTTCHPKFTATQRMIVHAVLDPALSAPRTNAKMPASISALYGKAGG